MRTARQTAAPSHHRRFPGAALLCLLVLVAVPALAQQPAIQYVYDELNRLIAVVDQQGNAAMYVYDAVGNMLRIERFTALAEAPAGLAATPAEADANTTVAVTLAGANLKVTRDVRVDNPGVTVRVLERRDAELLTAFLIAPDAPLGPTTVRVETLYGTATTTFTVRQPAPVLTRLAPADGPVGTQVVVEGAALTGLGATTVTFAGPGGRLVATQVAPATAERIVVQAPGAAVTGDVIVTTGARASNALTFTVTGPRLEGLDGLLARAATGTPADAAQASTNGNQVIVVRGSGLVSGMALRVPVAQNGTYRQDVDVALTNVSADGTRADVSLPKAFGAGGLISGQVRIVNAATGFTSPAVPLQAVPTVTTIARASDAIVVNGSGFAAGMVVRLPLAAGGFVDRPIVAGSVAFAGTSARVLPNGVTRGPLTVTTSGGTSAPLTVPMPVFERLENLDGTLARAATGTPADPTLPSTNGDHTVVVRGAGLTGSTHLMVPVHNGGYGPIQLTGISGDGTRAEARIVRSYAGPNFTSLTLVTGQQMHLADFGNDFGSAQTLPLQVVPVITRLTLSAPVVPGASLLVNGFTFTPGTTVRFPLAAGGTVVQTPTEIGLQHARVPIPAGVGRGAIIVTTPAGESGPFAFDFPTVDRIENLDGTLARAATGTPADPTGPSTNGDHTVVVRGAGLTSAMVLVAQLHNGTAAGIGLTSVSADGMRAEARIARSYPGPNFTTLQLATGPTWIVDPATGFESSRFSLQVVPILSSATLNGAFVPGASLTLGGFAFTSNMTVRFPLAAGGSVIQTPGSAGLTSAQVPIPNGVGRGPLSVITPAGESAPLALNFPTADRIENLDGTLARAATGTPADPAQPSTNGDHTVVVRGAGLTSAMVLVVQLHNGTGFGIGLTSVSADGTRAEARITRSYPGPNFTTLHLATGPTWVVNPANGFESSPRFSLQVVPVIGSATVHGPFTAGTTITLGGFGFTSNLVVRFTAAAGGTVDQTPNSAGLTSANVTIPATAAPGPVRVVTPGGESAPVTLP